MVSEQRKDAVSTFLLAQGACGLTEHHPALDFHDDDGPTIVGDPGEWRPPPPPSPDSRVRITGWFEDEGQGSSLHEGLSLLLTGLGEDEEARLKVVPDQDWNAAWKAKFAPKRIADGVWIVPSWCDAPPEAAGELQLLVDPGLAFGTGTHPTTAACVSLIRDEIAAHHPSRMLDIGTGTGILAIAGLKWGVPSAVGVDPDKNSVTAAAENAVLNDVGDRLRVFPGSVDHAPEGTFGLVVANLLAPLLVRLTDSLCGRTARGGALILSGMLDRQLGGVVRGFADRGFHVERELSRAGWSTVLLRGET
jgi:ribosomal protein L11 methyltransferase